MEDIMQANLDFIQANLANATDETIRRLRWAFPDLDHDQLEAMALHHPDVVKERAYWMKEAFAIRRRMKTTAKG